MWSAYTAPTFFPQSKFSPHMTSSKTKDIVKYVVFKALDGSKEFKSRAKFLNYLYKIGRPISDHVLKTRYMKGATNGTFTILGEHWVFTSVFGKDVKVVSLKKNQAPRKEYVRTPQPFLLPKPTKKIYELTPTHHLELTYVNQKLLKTKSISLS